MASQAERRAKKKAKVITMREAADRARTYILPAGEQPGRVPLSKIGFHPRNRGGQGILPHHVHSIALDLCTNGTSRRRYDTVPLTVVPEKEVEAWRQEQQFKSSQHALLPKYGDAKMLYATLRGTHFVAAHALIGHGERMYLDQPDGPCLRLQPGDVEGNIIQEEGVDAILYGEDLWYDTAAMVALTAENYANLDIARPETEIDAFETVPLVVDNHGYAPTE